MSAATGLRIGITIGLHEAGESLWNNGIKQNAIYLAWTLQRCPNAASVYLVNTTTVEITSALPWDARSLDTRQFIDVKDHLDVLIELGGQIDAAQTAYLRSRGTRLVSYCCGVEYISAMEAILFNRPLWGYNLFINQQFDAIWVIPQVANSSSAFFQTLRRQSVQTVPFVWDPALLEERAKVFPHGGQYRPRSGPRRLTVMEPNHDVVKFCLYPILIAEEAYRREPGLIERLHVTNALRIARESQEFIAIMNYLDIVREHKAVFLDRHDTPQALAELTDAMISHQWENPLNYFYFDVCWQGYALVHNAHMCSDLGYYYEGNDVSAGCSALLRALHGHDAVWEAYREAQRQALARFFPGAEANIDAYSQLLARLMEPKP